MNKSILALLMLAVGLGGGWLLRGAVDQPRDQPRSHLTPETAQPVIEARGPEPVEELEEIEEQLPVPEIATDPEPEAEPEAPSVPESEAKQKKGNMLLAQIPQARKDAEEEARLQAAAIAKTLGFDEERTARMQDAFAQYAGDRTEEVMRLLFGDEEIDEETLRLIDEGLSLDDDLERDLSLFLGDEDVLAVRREMDAQEEREKEEAIGQRIESLALPDLGEGQREEVREVLRRNESKGDGVVMLKAMRTMFREPQNAKALADDKEFLASIEEGYKGQREDFRKILTPEQFKRYESWERRQVAQTRMGVRMLGMISQMEGLEGGAGTSGNSISIGFGVGGK